MHGSDNIMFGQEEHSFAFFEGKCTSQPSSAHLSWNWSGVPPSPQTFPPPLIVSAASPNEGPPSPMLSHQEGGSGFECYTQAFGSCSGRWTNIAVLFFTVSSGNTNSDKQK